MENSYTKSNREWYPHVKKDFDSCIKEEDGYMTLLACLLFLVVAGLLLVCLDGSMLFQAKARCSMAQTGLTEHLLANYNVPLAKGISSIFSIHIWIGKDWRNKVKHIMMNCFGDPPALDFSPLLCGD